MITAKNTKSPIFRNISTKIQSPKLFRKNSKSKEKENSMIFPNETDQTQIALEDSIREESWTRKLKEIATKTQEAEERLKYAEEKAKEVEEKWDLIQKNDESLRKVTKTDKILLNIGGTIFATSKSTLLSTQFSFFYTMLFSEFWKPCEDDGAYFIDRDPKHFLLILNYMRTGKLNLSKIPEDDIQEIYDDLSYYQLCPWKSYWDVSMCSSLIQIGECNRRINFNEKMEEGTYAGVVTGSSSNRFKIKINTLKKSRNAVIGFTEKSNFKTSEETCRTGYYLYFKTGSVIGSNIPELIKDYTTKEIKEGTEIEGYYENNEIGFIIDGEDCGIAFSNIEEKVLYPAVSLNSDCELDVTLLDYFATEQ